MSDLFEKALEIYQLQAAQGQTLEADRNLSELNVVGYFRLKSSDGTVLLRIKAENVDEELERLRAKQLSVRRDAEIKELRDSLRDAKREIERINARGKKLNTIGGFWAKDCYLHEGNVYLCNSAVDWQKETGMDFMQALVGSGLTRDVVKQFGVQHILKASDFSLEIVTDNNKQVVGSVLKGALWGIGLGLLSGGLGLLGAAGGVLSGGKRVVYLAKYRNSEQSMLISSAPDVYQAFLRYTIESSPDFLPDLPAR